MKWVPSWLGRVYCRLYLNFGAHRCFSLEQAVSSLRMPRDSLRVALSMLVEAGWLERLGRGTYEVREPGAVAMAIAAGEALDLGSVPERFTGPLREFCERALAMFGRRLLSVVLFGSVARGDWGEDSDLDLLLVVEGLPEDAGRDELVLKLTRGIPHPITCVAYAPEELAETPPLLLDVAVDGIVLLDSGFIRKRLEDIRKRLEELGARRVGEKGELTWILKPRVELGEVIEV